MDVCVRVCLSFSDAKVAEDSGNVNVELLCLFVMSLGSVATSPILRLHLSFLPVILITLLFSHTHQ